MPPVNQTSETKSPAQISTPELPTSATEGERAPLESQEIIQPQETSEIVSSPQGQKINFAEEVKDPTTQLMPETPQDLIDREFKEPVEEFSNLFKMADKNPYMVAERVHKMQPKWLKKIFGIDVNPN